MMQWLSRWRGWIILVVLAVAFFPHFGKGNDGAAKQRYLSCLSFTVAFIAVSLLPEIFGALRGGHVGYFNDWLRQVVEPTIAPGSSPKLVFWDTWNGANLYN